VQAADPHGCCLAGVARQPVGVSASIPETRRGAPEPTWGLRLVQTAGMANNKRKRTPKTILKLPDLEQSKSAVLNSLTSQSSQRSYDHAIREFIDWYCSEPRLAFNKTVVTRYRISLEQASYASSTINLRLAAIRRLAYEAADCGLLSPDLVAGIRRVKGVKKHGMRIGNWLTAEQGRRLLAVFERGDLRGKRDYAMVAVLLGCGLRRAEAAALAVEDLQQREEHWVIADLVGKGGHVRTVPVPTWVKAAVDIWLVAARVTAGPIFRAINKAQRIGKAAFSPKVIWGVVKDGCSKCGLENIAPTTCVARAPACVMKPAGNSSRSSSCSAT
jgi:site-specific recombinase XerD